MRRPRWPLFSGAPDYLPEGAIRANVAIQTERLREGSAVLLRLEIEEQVLIVAAFYCLRSGEVELLDRL